MKGYLKFLAGLSAVMLLVLLVLAAWVRKGGTAEQDTLLYNDIVQTAREHPGDPAASEASSFSLYSFSDTS